MPRIQSSSSSFEIRIVTVVLTPGLVTYINCSASAKISAIPPPPYPPSFFLALIARVIDARLRAIPYRLGREFARGLLSMLWPGGTGAKAGFHPSGNKRLLQESPSIPEVSGASRHEERRVRWRL